MTTDQTGIRVTRLGEDDPTVVHNTAAPSETAPRRSPATVRAVGRTTPSDGHETKPFYLTSEFLVAAATMLALLVAGYLREDTLTTWRTWLLVTVVSAAYIVSRGLAKAGSPDRR